MASASEDFDIVREAIENAEANGFDQSEFTPREIARDLLDCCVDVEGWDENYLVSVVTKVLVETAA